MKNLSMMEIVFSGVISMILTASVYTVELAPEWALRILQEPGKTNFDGNLIGSLDE
jgi:hypothetical protein